MLSSLLIVLFLPLLAAVFAIIWKDNAPKILLAAQGISFLLALALWLFAPFSIFSINWIQVAYFQIDIVFLFQSISAPMLVLVAGITFLVMLYSHWYMHAEPYKARYFSSLGLFATAMQGIVLSGNLLQMFVFWEIVGFSSYLLIGFYRHKSEAGIAANKAFLVNRVGDAAFLAALGIIYAYYQTFDIQLLLQLIPRHTPVLFWQIVSVLLVVAAIAKSAQAPMQIWLPDAMQGPTPVSALLHAATMVVAGVYLLIQILPILHPTALLVVLIIGLLSCFMAALSASVQRDLKKILAYSTISQIGLMFVAIAVASPSAAFTHLWAHAFYKCLLFLGVGVVLHYYGNGIYPKKLYKTQAFLALVMLLGVLGLSAVPFTAGFGSKEAILSSIWQSAVYTEQMKIVLVSLVLLASAITAYYALRLWFIVFFTNENIVEPTDIHLPKYVKVVLGILVFACLFWAIAPLPFMHAYSFLGVKAHTNIYESIILSVLSVLVISIGFCLAYWHYKKGKLLRGLSLFFHHFYIDRLYWYTIQKPVRLLAVAVSKTDVLVVDGLVNAVVTVTTKTAILVKWIDRNLVDGLVHLPANVAQLVSTNLRMLHNGRLQWYFLCTIIGLLAIIYFLI